MKSLIKTTWVLCFALAMGYLEASVVVYLRALLYPEGFAFPLHEMPRVLMITELMRELATLVMIVSVAVMVAQYWLHRFAWFLVIFSVWDIAYYIFLKLVLDWPASIYTMDILFLLPVMWTGPVIAPIVNSICMLLLAGAIFYNRKSIVQRYRLSRFIWLLLAAGSVFVLVAYMEGFTRFLFDNSLSYSLSPSNFYQVMPLLMAKFIPPAFNWFVFCLGVSMHLYAIALIFLGKRNKR